MSRTTPFRPRNHQQLLRYIEARKSKEADVKAATEQGKVIPTRITVLDDSGGVRMSVENCGDIIRDVKQHGGSGYKTRF